MSIGNIETAIKGIAANAQDPKWVADVISAVLVKGIEPFPREENGPPLPATPSSVLSAILLNTFGPLSEVWMPRIMEEGKEYIPQLIALAFEKDTASNLGHASAVARGVQKLGKGIKGAQSLQHGLRRLGGEKLGVLSDLLDLAPRAMDAYREAKESGILDKIFASAKGGADVGPPSASAPRASTDNMLGR